MQKAKRTKRLLGSALLLILIFTLALTSCGYGEIDEGLEYGFEMYSGYVLDGGEEYGKIAFKSERSVFDIDDVTLNFSFGSRKYNRELFNFGKAEFCFRSGQTRCVVSTTDEDFSSEKYDVAYDITYVKDSTGKEREKTTYVFSHNEDITVPKELFAKDSGEIYYYIVAPGSYFGEPKEITVYNGWFKYEKLDGGTKIKIKQLGTYWEDLVND